VRNELKQSVGKREASNAAIESSAGSFEGGERGGRPARKAISLANLSSLSSIVARLAMRSTGALCPQSRPRQKRRFSASRPAVTEESEFEEGKDGKGRMEVLEVVAEPSASCARATGGYCR
jgi:hypothetical protein